MLHITPSERQALRLLANGQSPGDMAAGLGVSALEMEVMLSGLFAAMGATTRAEAVAVADRRGLLADEPPVFRRHPVAGNRESSVNPGTC